MVDLKIRCNETDLFYEYNSMSNENLVNRQKYKSNRICTNTTSPDRKTLNALVKIRVIKDQ